VLVNLLYIQWPIKANHDIKPKIRVCWLFSVFRAHFLKKLTEIVVSSVRPSVTYFSAPMAPGELKLGTQILWFDALNSTVQNFGFVRKSGHDHDPDFTHNFSFCGPNRTYEGFLERSKHLDDFQLGLDGHLHL
jgi:hypothetical protein